MLDTFGLVDIVPHVLVPTWSNRRVGNDNICKHLDRLLESADFLDLDLHLWKWVERGGDFDHQPVFLQLLTNNPKPRSPFKFNAHWLSNEVFVDLLKASWIVYVDNPLVSTVSHFVENLKTIKEVSISWYVKQKDLETE